ncbi:MAG TPA: SO_0444 family Cu/Zn efflux transporter [Anaerovoracaceae bacterium]|nr:SO_0444 family Cu/Zn efflux transporter [Anaerovoracaceae bacterium]
MKEFLIGLIDIYIKMAPYMVLGLIFVGILHVYVSKERIIKAVGKNSLGSVVLASVLGVPLPLCSCGVVPTGIELKKAGASNGAVISFLTSTPQTGVDSLIATYGMMGPFMAVFRAIAAFVSGIFAGAIANIFSKEEIGEKEEESCCCHCHGEETEVKKKKSVKEVFTYAFDEFLNEIALHFVIGVLIAGLITAVIPDDFFMTYGLNSGLISIVMMIVIGIPMYICSTSSIPVAVAFLLKGISPGAAFAFLFAGPITNAATVVLLVKTIGKKLTTIYIASAAFMALVFGTICNILVLEFGFSILTDSKGAMDMVDGFSIFISVVFLGFLIRSIIKTKITVNKKQEKSCCHN